MNKLVLLLYAVLLSGCVHHEVHALEQLLDLRWQNRIILLSEKGSGGLQQLQSASEGVAERHIVWFRLSKGALTTNYRGSVGDDFAADLQREFFDGGVGALLIGKDGGIKSRDQSLDLDYYFRLIDAMPMRQQEMRSGQ